MLGWSVDELVGAPLATLVPARLRDAHRAGFERFCATAELRLAGRTLRLPALRADGTEAPVELVLSMAGRTDPAAVVAEIRAVDLATADIEELVLQSVRDRLAAGDPIPDVLRGALRAVLDFLQWSAGAIWVVDPWTDRLRPQAVWSADPPGSEYETARTSATLARGEGLAGRVWAAGSAIWVDRAVDDPLHPPDASGLYFPLLDRGEAVGVLELVDRDRRGLAVDRQEVLWQLADELARTVAADLRTSAEQRIRRRLETALGARGMGIWSYTIDTGELHCDARVMTLYGVAGGEPFSGSMERWRALLHPATVAEFDPAGRRAGLPVRRFEFRHTVHTDHGVTWIEGSGTPITDQGGDLREVAGVVYDVTEEVTSRVELERRARHSSLAAQVGRAFVSGGDIDDRLQQTVEAIVEHLDAAFARIWMRDAVHDVLVLRASAGLYTHLDGAHSRVTVGELKIGRIAQNRAPHLTNDVLDDPHISDPDWARREGMQAFAGYPLVVGEECVGVLALFSTSELPDTTLDVLASVADTVAIGIDQARSADEVQALYEQTRAHAAELAAALEDRAQVATVLQESLLPASLPTIARWSVAGRYRAGEDLVGGDFYDLFPLGEPVWACLIGDVCGRGPEAARLTALARHGLRTALMLRRSPAEAVTALDELLRPNVDRRFCTVVCGVLDVETGAAEVAVAGHPSPLVVRTGGDIERLDQTGPLVGVLARTEHRSCRVRLEPGDTLVLYTDGVTEAHGPAGLFGEERLVEVVARNATGSADEIADAVLAGVEDFSGNRGGADDTALLVLQREKGGDQQDGGG